MRYAIGDLQSLASSVGFPDPVLAAAVAMAESGGNPTAVGDLTLGVSVGLWQINLKAHPQYDEQWLFDPTNNAEAALAISSKGTNWNPWTTYRTGAYKQFLLPGAQPSKTPVFLGPSGLTTAGAVLLGVGLVAVSALGAVFMRESGHHGTFAHEAGEAARLRVQSLVFSKAQGWTPRSARSWARSHGYRASKVDVTPREVRLRQKPPGSFRTIRSVPFGQGIRAIMGR